MHIVAIDSTALALFQIATAFSRTKPLVLLIRVVCMPLCSCKLCVDHDTQLFCKLVLCFKLVGGMLSAVTIVVACIVPVIGSRVYALNALFANEVSSESFHTWFLRYVATVYPALKQCVAGRGVLFWSC
jgi:hypothetical protein